MTKSNKGITVFKKCGFCGKSTDKMIHGRSDTIYVRLDLVSENLDNFVSQAYHEKCYKENVS